MLVLFGKGAYTVNDTGCIVPLGLANRVRWVMHYSYISCPLSVRPMQCVLCWFNGVVEIHGGNRVMVDDGLLMNFGFSVVRAAL